MGTYADFERAIQNINMTRFFEAVGLDPSEAKNLFDLLDISIDGTISAEEFLQGCLRLHGPAKSLDLLVLARDVTQLFDVSSERWKATVLSKEQPGKGSCSALASACA